MIKQKSAWGRLGKRNKNCGSLGAIFLSSKSNKIMLETEIASLYARPSPI